MAAVTPLAGGTTVLLVGIMLVRLTLTGAYQRYVRPGMGPLLLIAGLLLVLLGAAAVAAALRRTPAPSRQTLPSSPHGHGQFSGHDHDHDHEHLGRVGWLVLVPVLALLMVAPPALGSFGVDRSLVITTAGAADVFEPLPAGAGPRTMTLLEFDQRASDRAGQSMRGGSIRLTGFVARSQDGAGFRLARYQIACCAADAVAAVARISGASGASPQRDAWFTVTGVFAGVGAGGVPELRASAVQQIPAPLDPYEV